MVTLPPAFSMVMSSSRVRAIKLPGASTTSRFPDPASMWPESCVSVKSVRCETKRTLDHFVRPNRSHKLAANRKTAADVHYFNASAVSGNLHIALGVRNLGVAVAHVQAHVSACAAHLDVAIAGVDADLRSHVRN